MHARDAAIMESQTMNCESENRKLPAVKLRENPSHQATLDAFQSELKTARSLLEMQKRETRHCQEHISLLNGEIDTLRQLVEEKQHQIHKLNMKIQSKSDKVSHFKETFDQFRVDKLALYELEQQNAQLLERLKEKQKVIDELEIEITYLRSQNDNETLVDEIKSKKFAELQIVMPIEKSQLEIKLENALNYIRQLEDNVRELSAYNQQLKQEMVWNDEVKRDQLARSNQSEFRMLMQLDKTEALVKTLESEKELLDQTNAVTESRSKHIEKQYASSLKRIENVQTICGAVVDYVERDYASLQHAEQLLKEENLKLQSELQILREIITRASHSPEEFTTIMTSNNPTILDFRNTSSRSSLEKKLSPMRSPRLKTMKFQETQRSSSNLRWQEAKFVEFLQMMESLDKKSLKKTCLVKQLLVAQDLISSIQLKKIPTSCSIDLSHIYLTDDDVDEVSLVLLVLSVGPLLSFYSGYCPI
jgi:myosin heavy subunit